MACLGGTPDFASLRQRWEQNFTSSQFFSHFLRQTIGLPHWTQILTGSSDLALMNGDMVLAATTASRLLQGCAMPSFAMSLLTHDGMRP